MFRKLFILQLLAFCFLIPGIFANENVGNITGNVSLNVKEERIGVKIRYEYFSNKEDKSKLEFFLNGDFTITKVKCKTCRSFNFDKNTNPGPTLSIGLKEVLPKNKRILLEIEYSGKFGEMYNKENQFLELGLEYFWLPTPVGFGFDFVYRFNLKTDVPDFQLVSNGKLTRKGKNWMIESKTADFDANIIFAKDLAFKNYQANGYNLQVVSKNLPDKVSEGLLSGMVETLDFYNANFGKNRPQREVVAVFRPFPLDLGYFRKGFFILPSPTKAEDLFFTISHELAHFWWLKANQEHHWLNESFAEYSAMLALRKLRGMDKFNAVLERKKKLDVNLPPVYGFDRTKNRQQTPMVLYVKGALKLYDLEQMIGEEKFLQFLQKVEDERITETDKLVETLRKFAYGEIADKFLANLKDS